MRPPFIIQSIDRLFWTGAFWDASSRRAKLYPNRRSAVNDLLRHNQTEITWLIRPAILYLEKQI